MNHLTLILGGHLSGKSRYALECGERLGERKHLLATAQALDEPTVRRIEACKSVRSAEWTTIEESVRVPDVVGFLHRRTDVLVIDCVARWLLNLLIVDGGHDVVKETHLFMEAVCRVDYSIVVVSEEAGCGILPRDPVSQRFWEALGPLHQELAALSNEVYFMVAGRPLRVS